MDQADIDAVIVGSGPNGLAAAARLVRAGCAVRVIEASDTVGGGARSAELTLPGFTHDICSAVHPLAVGSPFLRRLPLQGCGLEWVHPPVPAAHPLDGGRSVLLYRSLERTVRGLGKDGPRYDRLMRPLASSWWELAEEVLQPLIHWPRHPVLLARFGIRAVQSAAGLAGRTFEGVRARALFGGLAGHSMLPFGRPASAAFGLMLGAAAHQFGWPLPAGGAGQLSGALAGYVRAMGGTFTTGRRIGRVEQLPHAKAVLLDLTPRQVLRFEGLGLSETYRKKLQRYRYGPGVFKVDYALDGPIPWEADDCRLAGTVHLGGTLEEMAASERAVARDDHPEAPFVLLVQPTLFDPDRAPPGKHTAWAYCHVPAGSDLDMTDRIERQIERFAPGFQNRILARHKMGPADLEAANPNLVGGDINGGTADLIQLLARPVAHPTPYRLPVEPFYLCSASTPPGGGVHGMCGYHAADTALADVLA